MDQSAVSVKQKIEKEILEVIIDGLYSGKLKVVDARAAARETLAQIKKIEEHEESVLDFYKNLSEKFPVFKVLYTKLKGEVVAPREVSAHRQALEAIHAGDIEGAQKIASTALAQTAHETANNN